MPARPVRTITVRLTEAQVDALRLAVTGRHLDLGDRMDSYTPGAARDAATLDRAWNLIESAWQRATSSRSAV
jgi:hypothetical protein